jgi:hypothetical protein
MAEWIVAASAVVNAVVVVALVCVTWRYANETKGIADAARRQADASTKMAEEMREQTRGARFDRMP